MVNKYGYNCVYVRIGLCKGDLWHKSASVSDNYMLIRYYRLVCNVCNVRVLCCKCPRGILVFLPVIIDV